MLMTPISLDHEIQSRAFFQKTLDALQSHIAILDENGAIIAVNSAWKAFANSNDLATEFCGPGTNYLLACDSASGECSEEGHVVGEGIRAVIAGLRPIFYLEYPCHSPTERRWFSVRVTSFEIDGHVRAVVCHDDITGRKVAEQQLNTVNRGLQQQTRIDGLTGIGNRRMFEHEYEDQWKFHQQQRQSLSLILVDIDFFKQYNDTLGHVKGDECLTAVAQAIEAAVLRPRAKVTRYGGEEFAVVLPDTDIHEAQLEAEAIRRAILSLQLPHPTSPIERLVTVSAGASTCIPQVGWSPAQFLHEADSALYRAKSSGRNRSVVQPFTQEASLPRR